MLFYGLMFKKAEADSSKSIDTNLYYKLRIEKRVIDFEAFDRLHIKYIYTYVLHTYM